MISAESSRQDRSLETFRLVLVLASQDREPPEGLKRYFQETLKEALALVENPRESAKAVRSEAILLALKISGSEDLDAHLRALSKVAHFEQQPAVAALRSLEKVGDTKYQLTDFGEAVRATL